MSRHACFLCGSSHRVNILLDWCCPLATAKIWVMGHGLRHLLLQRNETYSELIVVV